MSDGEPLEGIAAADARLGRPVALPATALPLTRWTEVRALADEGVEIEWNLDDSRAGAPGRLELSWHAHGLHLRLTAQGPWPPERIVEIAASVRPG
jgi:hypothetical protein